MEKKNKQIIYVFGNELLDFDNLPIKLLPDLQKALPEIDFQIIDPNENLKPINKELVIIDTIKFEKEKTATESLKAFSDSVAVFDISDLDKIKTEKLYSVHDFDLGFNLKLLKKIGKLDKILIFGVPMRGDKRKALKELVEEISNYLI